jgi:mono/diheme cytochrome c family protein
VRLLGGALAAVLVLVAGCGGSGGGGKSPATHTTAAKTTAASNVGARYPRQRAFFKQNCAACHTLADVGATGTSAGGEADLDAIRPNISSVVNYMKRGLGKMPTYKGRLSPREIEAVATYVAAVDGCGIRSRTECAPPHN